MRLDWTDNMLIAAMQNGCKKSFEVLFERYAERLYDFALKYVHHPEIAEELMMDVMLWLWQHREQAVSIEHVAPYLFRAIRNKVFDHLRKNALKTVPLDTVPEYAYPTSEENVGQQRLELEELEKHYYQTLSSLPPQCKKVFELSREEERTHAEICSSLNISKKTVEGHITNALKIMRRNLPQATGVAYAVLFYFLYK